MVVVSLEIGLFDCLGGIFVWLVQNMSYEDCILLQVVVCVVISDEDGMLVVQVGCQFLFVCCILFLVLQVEQQELVLLMEVMFGYFVIIGVGFEFGMFLGFEQDEEVDDLWFFFLYCGIGQFDNGIGSFSEDGCEYVVVVCEGVLMLVLWVNVIVNVCLGMVVSESVLGYIWFENVYEFCLMFWFNDLVFDMGGEVFYLCDEEIGWVWLLMLLLCRGIGVYCMCYGFGYMVYEYSEDGIVSELWVFVDVIVFFKFLVLCLYNFLGWLWWLLVIGYVEWVMGDLCIKLCMYVVIECDLQIGVLLVCNSYSIEFGGWVVFFDIDVEGCGWICDCLEFIGCNGSLYVLVVLCCECLDGWIGVGFDFCVVIQVLFMLGLGDWSEMMFCFGVGCDCEEMFVLVYSCQGVYEVIDVLDVVCIYWCNVLVMVQVCMFDLVLDVLVNGWLVYQILGCCYLGCSGYY